MKPGYYGRIAPRSGLAVNCGIECLDGVIDSDYTGEIIVLLFNRSYLQHVVKKGDRIAQLIVQPYLRVNPIFLQSKPRTTLRGTGGFGSTGR